MTSDARPRNPITSFTPHHQAHGAAQTPRFLVIVLLIFHLLEVRLDSTYSVVSRQTGAQKGLYKTSTPVMRKEPLDVISPQHTVHRSIAHEATTLIHQLANMTLHRFFAHEAMAAVTLIPLLVSLAIASASKAPWASCRLLLLHLLSRNMVRGLTHSFFAMASHRSVG